MTTPNTQHAVTLHRSPPGPGRRDRVRSTCEILKASVSVSVNGARAKQSDSLHSYHYDDRGRLDNIDNGAVTYAVNALGLRLRKLGNQAPTPGDANGDGRINTLDLDTTLGVILQTAPAAGNADCNGDASVNVLDITCLNNRIAAKTPGNPASVKRRYAYNDNAQQIGEYDDAGQPQEETVWLGNLPVALLQGGKTYYVNADQLNTPRVLTDTNNTIVWRWDNTDPFGAALPDEDPDGDGQTVTYNQRFAGQTYDAETGLHYNVNRYYDPGTGRYITSDPIGLEGGLNTYAYVGNNPLSYIDPFGLSELLGTPGWSDFRPPQSFPTITLTKGGVCAQGDPMCPISMAAAGISGPYYPETKTYRTLTRCPRLCSL